MLTDRLANGHSWHYNNVMMVVKKAIFRAIDNNTNPWFRCFRYSDVCFWIPSVSSKLAIQNSKFSWRRLWMISHWDFTLLYHLFQGGDPSQRGGFQDYDPYSSNYVEYPHRAPTPPSPSDRSASPPPQHREPGKANANFLFVLSTCFDRIPAKFFLKF